MLKSYKQVFSYLTLNLGFIFTSTSSATAEPVQCYLGNGGSYQVCDVQTVGPREYILTWPDGEKTAIVETTTNSGSWIEVRHVNSAGEVYGGGARYPVTHHEQGEWLCYHSQPSGSDIDFCVTP
jgi:hypothetical protein